MSVKCEPSDEGVWFGPTSRVRVFVYEHPSFTRAYSVAVGFARGGQPHPPLLGICARGSDVHCGIQRATSLR
jgi:hypothetical protein